MLAERFGYGFTAVLYTTTVQLYSTVQASHEVVGKFPIILVGMRFAIARTENQEALAFIERLRDSIP